MRKPLLSGPFVALMLVSACTNNGASDSGDKTSQLAGRVDAAPINYTVETVADGLDRPWSLAFLPDGDMLVTERTGRLLRLDAGGDSTEIYNFNRADGPYPQVHHGEGLQAGLFDVVLHPDFAQNRQMYISYAAKQENGENTLVLLRFTYSKDGKISNGEQIFAASPARKQGNHYGARIVFLPDGTLLMPVGEAFHFREEAQKLDNHFGKIIRINGDGTVPGNNPFLEQEGALPEIWSYGHRNPQGIILTTDERVLANEHGPAGGDEINQIRRGRNYGWPTVTYALDYSGGRVSPFEALDGTEQPSVHFTPSIAPSGFAQYSGDAFPEWQGDLFLSALALKHVRRVKMYANGSLGEQQELFGELDVRFRDVRSGPDGYLYLLTEEGGNGKVLRVKPK